MATPPARSMPYGSSVCPFNYARMYSGQMSSTNPSTRGITIADTGETYALTDRPFARGMIAISEQFRDYDPHHVMSLMWRVTLIGEVAHDPNFPTLSCLHEI